MGQVSPRNLYGRLVGRNHLGYRWEELQGEHLKESRDGSEYQRGSDELVQALLRLGFHLATLFSKGDNSGILLSEFLIGSNHFVDVLASSGHQVQPKLHVGLIRDVLCCDQRILKPGGLLSIPDEPFGFGIQSIVGKDACISSGDSTVNGVIQIEELLQSVD